jgi:DNA-binding transcriptional ArsR family regulator
VDGIVNETHPAPEEFRLSAVLAALAEPARLAAVKTLAIKGESPCTRLQQDAGLTISRTTFSHHQKVLREAGVLQATIRGNERILSLRKHDLDQRFPGLLDSILAAPDDPPADSPTRPPRRAASAGQRRRGGHANNGSSAAESTGHDGPA